MPAASKENRKPSADRPNAQAGPSKRPRPYEQRDPSGLPGVSKLKASIRQTKRFLAKEGIEPGLRIQTQRRLVSLEADLAKAEKRQVESKNGERYHMVKFFERQKLVRLTKRLKRQIEEATKSKEKKQAELELEEARVMLNYVLHYPNEKKYIAIFASASSADHPESRETARLVLPRLLPRKADQVDLEASAGPERTRLKILLETREMMRSGELPAEPEVELKERKGDVKTKKEQRVVIGTKATASSEQNQAAKSSQKKAIKTDKLDEEDDFFEAE